MRNLFAACLRVKGVLKLLVLLFILTDSFAQNDLPVPRNIQELYAKGTRTKDGKPGPAYWQNFADYNIKVDFNPATLLVKGSETINYINNSPDTLNEIILKLYPNLYQKGAQRLQKIAAEDVGEGLKIDGVSVANSSILTYSINGTDMVLTIPSLLPKNRISLSISFHYTLNKGSNIRTGQVEPNTAFIAYFFPRVAVYDDIDGWNRNQYLATQEFYNDFCNFKVAVTVPTNFIVWATGDLKNCSDVFTDKYCRLIRTAETTDAMTTIIDTADIANGGITNGATNNTWQFEANNVTDFVFATSDHYIWQSSSLVVDSATQKKNKG